MELRCAVGNGDLFVDHGRQLFISDINEFQCVVRRLTRLGDNECDALADKTNPVDRDHRTVRHHGTGDDPVGLDAADLPGKFGPSERETNAGGGLCCRQVDVCDDRMRMRRAKDREV